MHEAYRPSDAQLAYARRMIELMEKLAAQGEGSGVVDGQFLDPVVIALARVTIARAGAPI